LYRDGNVRKLSIFQRNAIIVTCVIALVYLFVFLFLNVTIEDASVPTLVNGITTSMSIVVALGGAMIGILFRGNMDNADPEAKKAYFFVMGLFIFPLVYPLGSYLALATNQLWFAVKYSLGGYLVALLDLIIVYLYTAKRWDFENEKQPESGKPTPENEQTPNQTGKKRRKWFSIKSLTLIALLLSTCSNIYFAVQNQNLQKQNQNIQNSLYALQNSLYNYQPFIYSNNTITSTMNTLVANPNDTIAVLFGNVNIDLKVITPYDGMLTISAKALNFTHINETNWYGLQFVSLNPNNLNYSEHSILDLSGNPDQYFILHDVINSIEDSIPLEITVILKPNWLPPNSTGISFDLGATTFEADLFAVRTNQTTISTFNENVTGMFTPTS